MKNYLTASLLLACSVPAWAGWASYASTPTTTEFYDSATLEKTGSKIKVWALTNHKTALTNLEGKALLSEKSLTTIDCATRKIGAEIVQTFTGPDTTGIQLEKMETPLRMTPIRAGTPDETLMSTVCH